MEFEVIVQLKKEVLDTEGRAIQETIKRLGFNALKGVDVTRRFVLHMDGVESDAKSQVEKIAREFLANPVSETFQVRKLS